MGRVCSTHKECAQNISKKTRTLGRPRYRWENIKVFLQQDVYWIHLVQNREVWWVLVNKVMKLQVGIWLSASQQGLCSILLACYVTLIGTGTSDQSISPIFWPMKIGPISYPEMLATNCQSTCNIPKEPRSCLQCGRSLKSCTLLHLYLVIKTNYGTVVSTWKVQARANLLHPKLLETCDVDIST